MKEVKLHAGHIALFEDMIKAADVVYCEANTFNDETISELIYHIENISPDDFKIKVNEVFCGEDYSEEYGEGYHKFIRYIFDYALRFTLSERVKRKCHNELDKMEAKTHK